MSAGGTLPAWVERLIALRLARNWVEADLAGALKKLRPDLPPIKSLTHMIRSDWESGKHRPGPRYRLLLAAVYDSTEAVLFGEQTPPQRSLWHLPDAGLNGDFTADDEERLILATAKTARLDAGVLDGLTTVLAGQRRLEDAIGPGLLLRPVAEQLDVITHMLRDASGPHRDPFGRLVAEWTLYTGWLHAALRRDTEALALLCRAEDMADDFSDGTIAAIATSFRGYVARQQGRPRAVVRASMAALATPGGHRVQRTFDQLQAAQGYAALGEMDQVRRLLDSAADQAVDAVEPPPPLYWYSEPFFLINIGMVHNEIGKHGDAADLLAAGLEGMPAEQRSAEWLSEYKAAYAHARDRA